MALSSASPSDASAKPLRLQAPHPDLTVSEQLQELASICKSNNIETFDVYGDFSSTPKESFLRKFETEVAAELGKEDAVFMPSG
ncbi:MAG: hypothetical protein SGILL_006633, partial [Bacillariaceae sp.]